MEKALINHAKEFLSSSGSPARRLLANGGNTQALRTNDVLRKDEWEVLDTTLVGVARQRLIGINDLREAGLVQNLGGLGTLFSQYEKLGDMSDADVDFAGVTDGEQDSVTFNIVNVPVPITHKDFSINIRRLMASRGPSAVGEGVDRTQIRTATEKVTEQLEELLFNGYTGGNLDGNTLEGYTTQSDRNTEAGSDWGTFTNIATDVIDAIDECEQDKYYGPFTLYVATTQYGQMRAFDQATTGENGFDQVMRIPGIERIRPGDRLTDEAVLVAFQENVVEVGVGQDLTVVEWETKGGLVANFKVLAAITPLVKSDQAAGSGVCQLTGI